MLDSTDLNPVSVGRIPAIGSEFFSKQSARKHLSDQYMCRETYYAPPCLARAIVRGTRISVEFIIELLANGWTKQSIIENYPQLDEGDIEAALRYATEVLKDEMVYPLP